MHEHPPLFLAWEDVTCSLCEQWIGCARGYDARMALAINHFAVYHPITIPKD